MIGSIKQFIFSMLKKVSPIKLAFRNIKHGGVIFFQPSCLQKESNLGANNFSFPIWPLY
jgi:hypothetical protein